MTIKTCLYCTQTFETNDKRQRFCSRTCSCTFNNIKRGPRSDIDKIKIKKGIEKYVREHLTPVQRDIVKNCKYCGGEFKSSYEKKLTCSELCKIELRKQTYRKNTNKKPTGGIREGSGRGKSGWYKGFFCNSTYELAFLIYHLDHHNDIIRYVGHFSYYDPERNQNFKYYPDFLVNGKIIEIKGYKSKLDGYKLSGTNGTVTIKYLTDLSTEFSYVKQTTKLDIKNLYQLYDNYKPNYNYICAYCNNTFSHDRKSGKFCSKRCSMSYNRNIRKY